MLQLSSDALQALQAFLRGDATEKQIMLLAKNGIKDSHRAHQIWSEIKTAAGIDIINPNVTRTYT